MTEQNSEKKVKYEEKMISTPRVPNEPDPLLPAEKKVDKDDIDKLKGLQQQYSDIMVEFGRLKVEKLLTQQKWTELESLEKDLDKKYFDLQTSEAEIATFLTEKYGQGEININTCEFKG